MALLDWVKAMLADAANRHSTVGTTLIILAVATQRIEPARAISPLGR